MPTLQLCVLPENSNVSGRFTARCSAFLDQNTLAVLIKDVFVSWLKRERLHHAEINQIDPAPSHSLSHGSLSVSSQTLGFFLNKAELTQEVAGSNLFTVMTNIFVTEFSEFSEKTPMSNRIQLTSIHVVTASLNNYLSFACLAQVLGLKEASLKTPLFCTGHLYVSFCVQRTTSVGVYLQFIVKVNNVLLSASKAISNLFL